MIISTIIAIADATSNRTLIFVAIIGSVTSVLVSVFNNRKLDKVGPAIHELRVEFNGHMKELIEAKEHIARSAGADQERKEARAQLGEEAIALQAAAPAEVIQVNPPEKPAIVKVAK